MKTRPNAGFHSSETSKIPISKHAQIADATMTEAITAPALVQAGRGRRQRFVAGRNSLQSSPARFVALVMPFRIVQSKQNSRLKQLRRALAQPGHKGDCLVGIEGPNLVEEALRAGLQIKCIFAGERMQHWLQGVRWPDETEVLIVPSGFLAAILATDTPQPVAALVEPPEWEWTHLFNGSGRSASLVIALAGLQDPGNLGTILRSAEAFGASGVVSLPGTVSAWNPKTVRASAGSIFRVPLIASDTNEFFVRMHDAGLRVLTTAMENGESAMLADLASPVALLIGNEGNGVPHDLAARAGGAVTIPCPGPVESLNAAVAASVLLYEASRQRSVNQLKVREHSGARR